MCARVLDCHDLGTPIRQALTEVSVLADVLHVVNGHRQYMKLEPVLGQSTTPPITYQYNIKKKVIV